jgi:uncharacterized protein
LTGPFVPIYGFVAVALIQCLIFINPLLTQLNSIMAIIVTVIIAIVLASLLEYCTGAWLEALFHKKWWDYSDERYHIKGHISLKYSLAWGILGYLVLLFIQPFVAQYLQNTPLQLKSTSAVILVVYFAIEVAKSLNALLNFQQQISRKAIRFSLTCLAKVKYINWNFQYVNPKPENKTDYLEHAACIDDLVFHPMVQTMKQFKHHHNTSCFDHSLNVSFTTYLLCKNLGWDYKSAARGGLLHDLFLYDWRSTTLEEGKHGFVHPRIALDNALREFTLNSLEMDIIVKHMFPLTWQPPGYKESLLVCLVDKYCAVKETFGISPSPDIYLENGSLCFLPLYPEK